MPIPEMHESHLAKVFIDSSVNPCIPLFARCGMESHWLADGLVVHKECREPKLIANLVVAIKRGVEAALKHEARCVVATLDLAERLQP